MAQEKKISQIRLENDALVKKIGEEFVMIGRRCKFCGNISLLPKKVCSKCFVEGGIEELSLSKKGTIFSYTVQNITLNGFDGPSPMAYIDLPEGLRVFSLLTECEPYEEKLKIGGEVEMTVKKVYKDKEGNDVFSYMFKPV